MAAGEAAFGVRCPPGLEFSVGVFKGERRRIVPLGFLSYTKDTRLCGLKMPCLKQAATGSIPLRQDRG